MPFYSELFLDIMELMRKQFLGASHNLSIFSKFFFFEFCLQAQPTAFRELGGGGGKASISHERGLAKLHQVPALTVTTSTAPLGNLLRQEQEDGKGLPTFS